MNSLTYGTMPSKDAFYNAFCEHMQDNARYHFELNKTDAHMLDVLGLFPKDAQVYRCLYLANYSCDGLYALCEALVAVVDSEAHARNIDTASWAGEFCGVILRNLGFEWAWA